MEGDRDKMLDVRDAAHVSAGLQPAASLPLSLLLNTSTASTLVVDSPGGSMRSIWDTKPSGVAQEVTSLSPASVIPMSSFDWDSPCKATSDLPGKDIGLMCPRGLDKAHPAGPMMLQYARDGCPVDVG